MRENLFRSSVKKNYKAVEHLHRRHDFRLVLRISETTELVVSSQHLAICRDTRESIGTICQEDTSRSHLGPLTTLQITFTFNRSQSPMIFANNWHDTWWNLRQTPSPVVPVLSHRSKHHLDFRQIAKKTLPSELHDMQKFLLTSWVERSNENPEQHLVCWG